MTYLPRLRSRRWLPWMGLCAFLVPLSAASWEGTINVDGITGDQRRVYVPDTSRPVKAVLINNVRDPQGPDNGILYDHPDWRALGQKWNLMQMDWVGRKGSAAERQEEAEDIALTLKQVAVTLGKPEIEFTGVFLQGLSGTGADAAYIAGYLAGRVGGVIEHHYPDVPPPSGVPALYICAGNDEFATQGYPTLTLQGHRDTVAPRAAAGQPGTVYLEPGLTHGSIQADQRFVTLWMDELLALRFPATIPTSSMINLPSWQNQHAWIGCFDVTEDVNQPWDRGDKPINVLIQAHPYTGGRPYIWLPSQRVAEAWKTLMETGYYPDAGTSVSLTAPAAGAAYDAGATVNAVASVSVVSGSVTKVEFLDNNQVRGTDTTPGNGWSASWPISTDASHNLVARATNSNGEVVTSSPIQVFVRRPADNPGTTVAGVQYAYYENASITGTVPVFSGLTPVRTGSAATFSISAGGPREANFAYRFTGYVTIATAGTYTFFTTSDDGSKLYLGTDHIVDNDGAHGAQERSGSRVLSVGKHAIAVEYAQGAGEKTLVVQWQGPGIGKQNIPNGSLTRVASSGDSTPPATPPAPTTSSSTSATPTLSGTTEAYATVRVYDGTSLIATVAAKDNGGWTVTLGPLATGTHSLTVTASDAAGNTSRASPAVVVTVAGSGDTTPPVTPAAPTVINGSTATPTLSGTTEAGATIRVLDGGLQIGTVIANGSGSWSFSVPTLTEGTHTLTVQAVDTAGNASGISTGVTVTVASSGGAGAQSSEDSGGSGCGLGAASAACLMMLAFCLRLWRE